MKTQHNIDGFTVQNLPIISTYARRIGVVDIINTLVPTQMQIDAGTIILGMILDTLTGRSPLYRLDDFFEHQDTELILGKKLIRPNFTTIQWVVFWTRYMIMARLKFFPQFPCVH